MSIFSPGDMKRYKAGQITANGTSTITLTVNVLELDSWVHTQLNTPGGTVAALSQQTKVASTANTPGSISWISTAGNTSTYDVFIMP